MFRKTMAATLVAMMLLQSLSLGVAPAFALETDADQVEQIDEMATKGLTDSEDQSLDANAEEDATKESDKKIENMEKSKDAAEEEEISSDVSVLSYEDNNVRVRVELTGEETVPEDSTLSVCEIIKEHDKYDAYRDQVKEVFAEDNGDVMRIKLYDISILANDEIYEPSHPVLVSFEYVDGFKISDKENVRVVHFKVEEEKEIPEVILPDVEVSKKMLQKAEFETESFSVYAIAEIENSGGEVPAGDVFTGDDPDGKTLYIGNTRNGSTGYLLGINKDVTWMNQTNTIESAQAYRFTKITDGEHAGQYTLSFGDMYLNLANGLLSTSHTPDYFILTKQNNVWLIQDDQLAVNNYVNRNVSNGFTAWKDGYSDMGNRMTFYIAPDESPEGDGLGIGGKTYGVVNYKGTTTGVGLMNTPKDDTHLSGLDLLVRENPMDRDGILLDGTGSDISMWTFESLGGYNYRINTVINGEVWYLAIDGSSNGAAVKVVDTPDETTVLTVQPGTGQYKNMVRIKNSSGQAVNLNSGSSSKGFGGWNDGGPNEWHYLVEPSAIQEDNYVRYTAQKVSVSDTVNVQDGDSVIVYTRIWNEQNKEYEYYGVDHDGSLFKIWNSGDVVEWVGVEFNTTLWKFTEYTYDNGKPNFYYELQNTYSNKYISPQIGKSPLADEPIGININGRRYGDYYSPILAWDSPHYDYAGLKISDDNMLVSDTMAQCGDFYFAVMSKRSVDEHQQVTTLDNNDYDIKMELFDYSGRESSRERLAVQTDIMGSSNYTSGITQNMVKRNLDDGFPVSTATGLSLDTLFSDTGHADVAAYDANHLFSQNTHDETGYFEYSCFDNFAAYDQASGNFKVYEAIGSPLSISSKYAQRGNFLPFNDLSTQPRTDVANYYDGEGASLNKLDPRYGETIYKTDPETTNYYFGMRMSASFMQNEGGTDAWGHDVIFDFYGDDDMWLYVDDVLVLDLGGIHDAHSGTVNFKTGAVRVETGNPANTTLRNLFALAFAEKNEWNVRTAKTEAALRGVLSNEQLSLLDAYMDEKFDGETFRNYTTHTMKMFYMERGAGASNLRMKFNLNTVYEGDVTLSKEISGTDKADFSSVRFPYQIFWRETEDSEWIRLNQAPLVLDDNTHTWAVVYKNTNTPVDGETEAVINGARYQDVFYLKPGEAADIHLGSDDYEYYIREVGIDTSLYNEVYGNKTLLSGTVPTNIVDAVSAEDTMDFAVPGETVGNRKQVEYTNHVEESELKTLTVTKHLYREDYDGVREHAHELKYPTSASQTDLMEYDDTTFRYRVYFSKTAPDDNDDITDYYYRFGIYYVKDPQGHYCRFEPEVGFVSLGKTHFNDLTDDEITEISFRTSMNGMVDHIPAGYSIEIRNLLADTWFMVEEQDHDIPEGYTRLPITDDPNDIDGYEREGGSFITGKAPNQGWTRDNNNHPHLFINNKRGFGFSVTKEWSDADYMTSRDPIYVALYKGSVLVPDTLRRIPFDKSSQYYYYDSLPFGGELSDYEFREVKVTGDPECVDDIVINEPALLVEPVSEGDFIVLHGEMLPGDDESYKYTVNYELGSAMGSGSNYRADVIRNSRPGIKIVKTNQDGEPLSGAVFAIEAEDGTHVGKNIYTSDAAGLVTIAYLNADDYVIEEVKSPKGYQSVYDKINLHISDDGEVSIDPSEDGVSLTEEDGMLGLITIENRPFNLKARKVDASNDNAPMEGVKFALYRELETSTGVLMKDYNPIEGYSNLVSDENGYISGINNRLSPGAYYLSEITAPGGYNKVADIRFVVSNTGKVTCNNNMLSETELADGTHEYVITIPNTKGLELTFTKDWSNGISSIAWPKDGEGEDVPLLFDLKRRHINGSIDASFLKTLRATSDSLTFVIGSDSTVVTQVSGNADTGYKMFVTGLPARDEANRPWEYFVTEQPIVGFTTTYKDEDGVPAEEVLSGYTIQNTQQAVVLRKLDANDETKALSDAEFILYSNEACTEVATNKNGAQVDILPTDSRGYASLGSLPDGHYYLKETVAPSGYSIADVVEIIVDSGTVRYSRNDSFVDAEMVGSCYYIKVYDEASTPVPTGVKGVPLALLFVAAFGFIVAIYMRRKKCRRQEGGNRL